MKTVVAGLLLLGFSAAVLAHGDMAVFDDSKTSLDASAAITWRSAGAVDKDQPWRIPGIMSGGEAWPVEKGLAVDEVMIQLQHAFDDNWYGVLKAGTHGGSSDDHGGIELEHAYVGWRCCKQSNTVMVEAGKLMAAFSPGIASHATDREFSEAPLVQDAFLGRHFHDEGVRARWQLSGFTVGAEYWRGNAYPATTGEEGGSADVFARYQWSNHHWFLQAGAWLMRADADLRSDHRYSAGHQHNTAFVAQIPDVRFTGRSDLWGLHGHIRWSITHHTAISLQGEWLQMSVDGDITDGTRTAALDGDYQGGWVQAGLHWHTHSLLLRAEELSLENRLSGAGAPQLSSDANLDDPGKNPSRLSLGWHWQFKPYLAFRLEGVKDDSLLEDRSRIALGVVWKDRLWSR